MKLTVCVVIFIDDAMYLVVNVVTVTFVSVLVGVTCFVFISSVVVEVVEVADDAAMV